MKNILFATIFGFALMQSACLTSLHPLVTAESIVSENRVIGNWVADDVAIHISPFKESKSYKGFTEMQSMSKLSSLGAATGLQKDSIMYEKGYSVRYSKDGVEYALFGALTRIGDGLYFDLIPVLAEDAADRQSEGFEYTNNYLPSFTMARLDIANNNTMTLQFLNGEFIKELLKKGQAGIKHEKNELFETFLVTASSKELQQFIGKYSRDERLFSKENSVTLTRKG